MPKWIPGALITAGFFLVHWLAYRAKGNREFTRRRQLPGCTVPGESERAFSTNDPLVPE